MPIFFFYAAAVNADFSELKGGERVRYKHGKNDKGVCAIGIEVLRPAAMPVAQT